MSHILAPVQGAGRSAVFRISARGHVQIDHFRTSVHLDDRGDQHNRVVADLSNELPLAHRQAVGQLHEHFGRPRLWRVNRTGGPVHGLGLLDQSFRFRLTRDARVSEALEHGFVVIEPRDGLFVRDCDDDHLPTLFRFPNREHFYAGRCCGQRTHVLVDLGRVAEHVRRTHNVPQDRCGRRNG